MGRVVKIISDVLFTIGLLIAGLFLLSHFTGRKPVQVFIVSSGSMEPAIQTGSIVFVAPQKDYSIGDIITFKSGSSKNTTTHRIIGTGSEVFKVAGDANDSADPGLVQKTSVVGKVRLAIPYLGFIAAFAKTPQGFILLVIVPATIIIYEELKSLITEIKKKIPGHAGMKQIASQPDAGNDQAARSALANAEWQVKPAIILPIFFALFVPLTFSISYFIDHETSPGNAFTGWAPVLASAIATPTLTPTPTSSPQVILINEIFQASSNKDEWVELYNPTSSPINVSGWKIADASTDDTFPATSSSIPADGYAVIVAKNTSVTGINPSAQIITLGNATIGSGLNADTETVTLKDITDLVMDQVTYGVDPAAPPPGSSLARVPNGSGSWIHSATPSAGFSNP